MLSRSSALLTLIALLACNNATPPTAPDAQPAAPGLPEPVGTPVVGRFVKTRYDVTGTVSIVIQNGIGQLDLSPDFSVAQTPGPSLYLNTTNNPNTGAALRIGSLKGKGGSQRFTFTVPPGARYTWVIIWCDPYNVPMAEAAIAPTP